MSAAVDEGLFGQSLLDEAEGLQLGLVTYATGGEFAGGDGRYKELRSLFVSSEETRALAPGFLRRCRDLGQFWQWIKFEKKTYAERRELLWEEFAPLLNYLEAQDAPGVQAISEALKAFDAEHVHAAWRKALERRFDDPEGAITAARALLESACKHVIEESGEEYPPDADLPQLWRQASVKLKLAPEQHQEEVFKAILGNSQSVVNNLAYIRNKLGDAHGVGRLPVRPKPRHAELAVNLAGSMAAFLVATWLEQSTTPG